MSCCLRAPRRAPNTTKSATMLKLLHNVLHPGASVLLTPYFAPSTKFKSKSENATQSNAGKTQAHQARHTTCGTDRRKSIAGERQFQSCSAPHSCAPLKQRRKKTFRKKCTPKTHSNRLLCNLEQILFHLFTGGTGDDGEFDVHARQLSDVF